MKKLFLDIETAPNKVFVWGLFNQTVSLDKIEEPGYTLCWAAKWAGDKDVMFSSVHEDGKKGMARKARALIDAADMVVHYNGSSFDIPILNKEFVLCNLAPPSPVLEVDLLQVVRKKFKFPSNKLSFVAEELGLGGKLSHKGMALWRECMDGDDEAWETMKKYNIQDVALLEKLYDRLLPWIPNHPNAALFTPEVEHVCPNCGSKHVQKRGSYYTATMEYQRWHCQDCGAWSRSRTNNVAKDKKKVILKGV